MWLRELLALVPETSPRSRAKIRSAGSPTLLAEPTTPLRAVPERFVQDMWSGLLFDTSRLQTVDGCPVRILDPGTVNTGSGPDFRGARVVVGDVEWLGDVEIHVRSYDWIAHRHQADGSYDSVVLHVVLVADIWTGRLVRPDGTPLPEIVLLPVLGRSLRSLLRTLRVRDDDTPIACGHQLEDVPRELVAGWTERLGMERLHERKELFAQNTTSAGSIAVLLYHAVFEALGYARNTRQMLDLARRVPRDALLNASPVQREAILLGTAGFLSGQSPRDRSDDSRDPYVVELEASYAHSAIPLHGARMESLEWSFFRLRPTNFPTIRIAQAAALFDTDSLLGLSGLERSAEAIRHPDALKKLREMITVSPAHFWDSHVRLEAASAPRSAAIGVNRADRIILNALLPALLLHAEFTGSTGLSDDVYSMYRRLPPEHDERIGIFAERGHKPRCAIQSQGMHQLYRTRCKTAGCLSCAVGRYLLSGERVATTRVD